MSDSFYLHSNCILIKDLSMDFEWGTGNQWLLVIISDNAHMPTILLLYWYKIHCTLAMLSGSFRFLEVSSYHLQYNLPPIIQVNRQFVLVHTRFFNLYTSWIFIEYLLLHLKWRTCNQCLLVIISDNAHRSIRSLLYLHLTYYTF